MSGTPSNGYYRLQHPICDATKVCVRSAVLNNNLHNIRDDGNWLVVSNDNGVTYTKQYVCPAGYYTATEFIVFFNLFVKTYMSVATDTVTLSGSTLTWNMPTGMRIQSGPLVDILGIVSEIPSGTSSLFLALPASVALVSSMVSSNRHYSCSQLTHQLPILCNIPLRNGYGAVEVFEPTTEYMHELGGNIFDLVHIIVCDPFSNTEITEVRHFSLELELY